jgi:dethiobiotin synthetase
VQRIIVITGTDTGVGKTVFTALLTAHLVRKGLRVAALKPIASGPRDDARMLRRASGNALGLDSINPWHFRAPIAPLLAARKEKLTVRLQQVLVQIRTVAESTPRPDFILVEGAGGLLSPLGMGFSTRDLIAALEAKAIIVAANKLGAVNHIRLTLEALPAPFAKKAWIVLMSPAKPGGASRSNAALLIELIGRKHVMTLPHFTSPRDFDGMLAAPMVRGLLDRLLK